MDQRRRGRSGHEVVDRSLVDVGEGFGHCLGLHALLAHALRQCQAFGDGLREELLLPGFGAAQCAPLLVADVVGAKGVAVSEDDAASADFDDRRVGQQRRAAPRREGSEVRPAR